MRFRKITYHNYRCFLNETIQFNEKGKQNINLLVGPNGGGKTETLFSFWWALYDFDFSSLRAKQNTPYALNSALYRKLDKSTPGSTESCYVSIEFEHEGEVYLIKKTSEYKKTEKRITSRDYQEFSKFNENKELSIPERDPDEITKKLDRIIPKSILYGIIFDGERMQKLSISDESSKNAIRGVISDITNVDLIEKCSSYFGSINKGLSREMKKIVNKSENSDLSEILSELSKNEEIEKQLEDQIEKDKELLDEYIKRCDEISNELQSSKQVSKIEEKRKIERDLQKKHEDELTNFYRVFSDSMVDAYLLISEQLLDDVDSIISKSDVPEDLTVPAVKNILKRNTCICGCELTEESRKTLELLMNLLPPDNINSTLSEMIRNKRTNISDIKIQTGNNYKFVSDCEEEIKKTKDNILSLSKQIAELTDGRTEGEIVAIKKLEDENIKKREKIAELNITIPLAEGQQKKVKKLIEELRSKRDNYSKNKETTQIINSQITFIEKCQKALEMIREINKDSALANINNRIDEAFKLLSEDAELGRRLRIVQYDKEKMYNMVVYIESKCEQIIDEWKKSGLYQTYLDNDMTEDCIKEKAILNCVDSNSTGQSKMNTLAFVKAILDYSNSSKGDDGIEINKEYPLLIDSPFGDISGDNLIKSSAHLNEFSGQIILMLDNDHYNSLKVYFDKYISNIYVFDKINEENHTTITCKKEI